MSAAAAIPARPSPAARAAEAVLWILFLALPFYFAPDAKDAFRLPKLLLAGWLALASLACLAWDLRRVERPRARDLWRLPAVRAIAPILLVASLGLATTAHAAHARPALADLWIGAACLAAWSVGLTAGQRQRLLSGLLLPAAGLAALALDQASGALGVLAGLRVEAAGREALTATAGNAGELAAALVLPALVGQWHLARGAAGVRRVAVLAALALCLGALALTQTLAALAALAAGSAVLWLVALPSHRRRRALALGAVLLLAPTVALPGLRGRIAEKAGELAAGEVNAVLTGRLDGWRAALWMLASRPLSGVGHGAFPAEYAAAKLALLERGVAFYPQPRPMFADAHNDFLEAGAEWGLPGLAALAWGLWVLGGRLRRPLPGADAGLARGGVAALAVLALAHFPLRAALVAYPVLLFLAWVLEPEAPA